MLSPVVACLFPLVDNFLNTDGQPAFWKNRK